MVMSALEKNPRVMAEWAKQKEAAAAAAAPPPMPVLENPAKAEPKPLPHFPEPTAEEAAVIYGFGKGVRGLDAEEEAAGREELPAPVSPKVVAKEEESSHKPAAPAKNTVTGMDFGEEENFDGMETATDRRRANTDFEVPENVGTDPIYSYGRDFEPITFPSEKDVPPKHVKEDAAAPEAVVDEPAAAKSEEKIEGKAEQLEAPAPVVEAKQDESTDWDIRPASEIPADVEAPVATSAQVEEIKPVELVSGEAAQEDAPSPLTLSPNTVESESALEQSPVAAASKALPERVYDEPREQAPAIAASTESTVEEGKIESTSHAQESTSRGGWMDMMSPVPSEPAAAHWMESLASSEPHTQVSEQPLEVEATAHVAEPTPAGASYEVAPAPVTQQPSEIEAKAEEVPATVESETPAVHASASDWSDQLASAPSIDLGGKFDTEPRSFGESTPQFGSTSYHFASGESAVEHERIETIEKEEPAPVVETPAELLVSPADAPRNENEPEHSPSEPLFVSESLEAPASEGEPAPPEPLPAIEPQPEPAFAEALESHEGLLEPTPSSFFEAPESVATMEEEFSERIPTLPPTSRESLSAIPFLVPPSAKENHASNGSSDNAVVDDVVRKVLEKLQPQLQEMLSQGMKPLLENLIQNELEKKDR